LPRAQITRSTLTEREIQILELIGKGKSNSEISQALNLSEATVKHYITPLFRKLGVKNRTEAALSLTT
jgi:DNA-binding NarL/FixJ family response regulator